MADQYDNPRDRLNDDGLCKGCGRAYSDHGGDCIAVRAAKYGGGFLEEWNTGTGVIPSTSPDEKGNL